MNKIGFKEDESSRALQFSLTNQTVGADLKDCYVLVEDLWLWSSEPKGFWFTDEFPRESNNLPLMLKGSFILERDIPFTIKFVDCDAEKQNLIFEIAPSGTRRVKFGKEGIWKAGLLLRLGGMLLKKYVCFSWTRGEIPKFKDCQKVENG